ncbi:heparan-alpha-glucosaminide N-acetyltransferase domain-containing protein [uncultured Maribacter sp.]|uniref:heparan-alpha-glucosaminide N-acetyltransferase domain-containing protein n=1 Tax=uncultured Maribacter sp. TaxID=431308 RepID=UPI0026268CFD|nr:heparan-alpha-glucosaminide N-acetyltransferase domain-containing protein [uncultured Maribacter sp.]
MNIDKKRLYFIDAIRAWAILMMLQGHFIDGLLDPIFRDDTNLFYSVWKYFRGITAPVFFTVSGFIFTFLLIKNPIKGLNNPRVKKGITRGLQLIGIGYLLRINLLGLLHGEIYDAFYLVDVLHCIGVSLLGIITIYILTCKQKNYVFPTVLGLIGVTLFIFEPLYEKSSFSFLPQAMANYFAKSRGSVFTIIPWFGYTALGGTISFLFKKYKEKDFFYPLSIIGSLAIGLVLIFFSSDLFMSLSKTSNISLFASIYYNNYLFIRFGDVLVVFAVFMTIRQLLTNKTIIKLGQSTLSIYIIHFIILYGSFTGVGLYRFLNHSLSPTLVIVGAAVFMVVCSTLALFYEKHKQVIIRKITEVIAEKIRAIEPGLLLLLKVIKSFSNKILKFLGAVKN